VIVLKHPYGSICEILPDFRESSCSEPFAPSWFLHQNLYGDPKELILVLSWYIKSDGDNLIPIIGVSVILLLLFGAPVDVAGEDYP
jgi:hypothetical protein